MDTYGEDDVGPGSKLQRGIYLGAQTSASKACYAFHICLCLCFICAQVEQHVPPLFMTGYIIMRDQFPDNAGNYRETAPYVPPL